MKYTTPQINTISHGLHGCRNDEGNLAWHIRTIADELAGLDSYVRGLEDANNNNAKQLALLRAELANTK
jgi:hypothetical protein